MHIDKIYIEDNFVPDYATDQFRRKKVGISVSIKEGEAISEAVKVAEDFISEYISKNTAPERQKEAILAPIQPEEGNYTTHIPKQPINKREKQIEGYKKDIATCGDVKVLGTYQFLIKTYPELQKTYDLKLKSLTK